MHIPIKRIVIAGLLTIGLAILVVPSFRSHIFFLNFVDEDDNIVIGNYVSEGKELYKDVYTQHQPIPFHLSSLIENIVEPDNILMTVKRHREFVILWSLVWIFILTLRFGFLVFATSAIIEVVKINLLGNLFLAESLVVYPLLYVMAYFTQKITKIINWETWLVALLIWILIFSLAPICPLLGVLFLYLIYKSKNRKLTTSIIILLGLILFALFFGNGNFLNYWHDVISINYKYYIPLTTPAGLWESVTKAFFAPLVAVLSTEKSVLLSFIQMVSLGFILEITWLVKDRLYRRALMWVVVLFLANIRYIDPSNTLYGAFHMLPWLSVLVFAVFAELPRLMRSGQSRFITGKFITLIVVLSAFTVARTTLWDSRNLESDFYINYSPHVDIHKVVQILSNDSIQTVWVEPVEYWPYWKTGAGQYSEMINYYGWMDQTPPMKQSLDNQFREELPTIVWAKTTDGIGAHLGEYIQLKRDGKPIDLYLRKDKATSISDSAIKELDYYRFKIN